MENGDPDDFYGPESILQLQRAEPIRNLSCVHDRYLVVRWRSQCFILFLSILRNHGLYVKRPLRAVTIFPEVMVTGTES